MIRRIFYIVCLCILFLLYKPVTGFTQYKIKGTVYDSTRKYPVELVTVMSTSGKGTITNMYGEYEIEVGEKDSIWFSYLNKPTVKFPVLKINSPFAFDISLQVSIPELSEVKVRPRNYRQDSLQNREDYAKVFNFQKPTLKVVTPQYGGAVGFDVNELINAFRFKRNRSMLAFQQRLLEQEREKYVDYRFNKALVRRLTQLDGHELDSFMQIYRPSYTFCLRTSEYDFQLFIKTAYRRYKLGLPPEAIIKEEDPELGF